MAEEYLVKKNKRKTKRDINKVFSNNFYKILTEIILNADDSYKRLERVNKDETVKQIIVDINRSKKRISVIDYAEGMNKEDYRRIFSDYGGEHHGNVNGTIRGLFGQGASDVLFFGAQAAKTGKIESIKDDALHVCKFILDDEQKIKPDTITKRQNIKNFRSKFGITGNGTVVTFGLGNRVSIPHKTRLKDKIEKFYMLRYVLADPKREVIIRHDKIKQTLSSKHLLFEEEDRVMEKRLTFKFETYEIPARLRLYEDKDADSEEKVLITDPAGIVYDNTLFGLEEMSGAARLRGELVLDGIYECLTDYLNAEDPQEILSDSRDGFDQRETFTRKLFGLVKPYVKEAIKQLSAEYEPEQFVMDRDKKLKNMLKKINQYYRDLKLEEIGTFDRGDEPPSEGIRFVREEIYITQGKTYGLQLMLNANLIASENEILVECDDAVPLDLVTKRARFKEADIDANGLVVKSIILKGKHLTEQPVQLRARCLEHTTNTAVSVVEETIVYPENGLEFIPKEVRVRPGKTRTLNLYVDLSRFPLQAQVTIERSSRSQLIGDIESVIMNDAHVINESLARIPVEFKGGKLYETHHYTARIQNVEAKGVVRVEESEQEDTGLKGLFSGLEAQYDSVGTWQSRYDRTTGKIFVNLSHKINRRLLPDITEETIKQANYSDIQYFYIFELVCLECAKQICQIKLEKNEIKNEFIIIQKEIQKFKTDLYQTITG